ncbi:chitinase [Kutzneria buriramensis]|uniref:chitinase n=1 Tax=Kutzneria buriramensis TaxID=1045776 RepID=A0A3E0HZ79_9PSEU|nr:glycoside hydrolase family 18 protein [Kutzneria buriramensis]REH51759.1 chitinase [Kutzneria buriramensis]
MSRKWTRWLAGAVAAATVVLGTTATAAAASNLLANPGFEAGNTSGWTCSGATTVSSPVHSGSYALAATPAGQDYAQCSQKVTVLPNSAYTLSAYVQGSYIYLGATGTGGTDPQTWTVSGSYTQLSTSFTTGANTTSVTVYIHGWYGQPTYYADDFVLSGPGGGGGTPTAPAAPTGLTAPSTTSSSVSLAWTAPSGDVTGYNVYQNGTKVGTASGTSYTATGLSASTTYSYAVTAYNSVGESPKSSTVSATTTASGGGNPGGSLPAHVLTGYWQNFVNSAKALKLADVPTSYDLVAVAFADATGTPGAISFTLDSGLSSAVGGYSDAQFTADIATLHSRGQKVILSVGGQNGTISVGDSSSATNFANSAYSLIQKYGFDGVDIDLENGVNATYMAQALHSLAGKVGSSMIVTMAPQTIDMQSTGMAYFQLALNIKDILTIVNTQYYNSGTMNGCDQGVYAESTENFVTALACIQLQGGLRADQVGLGLPATSGAAPSGGYLAPSTVNAALDCLAKGTSCGSFKPSATYPTLRGAMTWSINWDASSGYAFANTVHPHLAGM